MIGLSGHQPTHAGAVVVGGVGEGLGFALAARFAAAGHPVVMLARSAERLGVFAQKIAASGGIAQGRAIDLREEEQVNALFDDVATEFGNIDAAIYNAAHTAPLLDHRCV